MTTSTYPGRRVASASTHLLDRRFAARGRHSPVFYREPAAAASAVKRQGMFIGLGIVEPDTGEPSAAIAQSLVGSRFARRWSSDRRHADIPMDSDRCQQQ